MGEFSNNRILKLWLWGGGYSSSVIRQLILGMVSTLNRWSLGMRAEVGGGRAV